jgi:molybdate transport system regulatory protein
LKRPAARRLTGHLDISTDAGAYLGDTRVRLLEAIDACGSITQAAKQVPLSYKAAWDAVDAMNNLAEQPLVERSTGGREGGGTRLTEHGRRVVALYRAVESEYQAALDRLAPRFARVPGGDVSSFQRLLRRMSVRISARNQFVGTVSALEMGPVDVQVQVQLDDTLQIAAVVTRESAEQLGLAPGREVMVLVKAPSVQITTGTRQRGLARNRLWGTVQRIVVGPVNTEVTLDLGHARTATAVLPRATADKLGLAPGMPACASFKVSSVLLAVVD